MSTRILTVPDIDPVDDPTGAKWDAALGIVDTATACHVVMATGKFGSKKPCDIMADKQGDKIVRFSCAANPGTVVVVDLLTLKATGSVFDSKLDAKDVDNSSSKSPDFIVEETRGGKSFLVRDLNHRWFILKFTVSSH